jgi:plasmid stabilization system protein ParE
MRVVFSAAAKADLRQIAHFIARHNKARALSFVAELRAKAMQLADPPRAFPLVPRYEHHGIRRRPFHNYLIFYRVGDGRVEIVHILHGARDYEPLLFGEH